MSRVRGLDVSACQGIIDFDRLPSWVGFLVVKVSEGETGLDPMRARNLAEARRRHIPAFVYLYFRSSQDPQRQADELWKAVGDTVPLLAFVDFETIADGLAPADAVARVVACVRAVKVYFGGRCGVYLYPWFAKGVLGAALLSAVAAELGETELWMADYSGGEDPPETWNPYVPRPWTTWRFAQTSGDNSSHVPGIDGAVDHDVFNGTTEDLRVFCGLPRPDQLEPDAPIVHPPVYGWTDEPDDDPPPTA